MKKVILLLAAFVLTVGLAACGNNSEEGWDKTKNITVYTRDTTSGTRAGFMGGIDFKDASGSNDVLVDGFIIKNNAGIMETMATDEYGIGYVSLASVDDTVKGLSYAGVAPTTANVINNTYGLKRPFNFITREQVVGGNGYQTQAELDIVLAFVAFMGTSDGAAIITDKGAVPLDSTQSWDDIKANHTVCSDDNSAVTIKFGGSDSIVKIAEALSAAFAPKCGNFVPNHDHTGSGDGYKRTQGANSDWSKAEAKHIGFASRPFKTDGSEGTTVEQTDLANDATKGQLAWDAIVAIVHKDNELNNITGEELKKIYEGTFTTWADLLSE